jgi:hypothetical protein
MPKLKLTEFHRTRAQLPRLENESDKDYRKRKERPFLFWDTKQAGLALQVRPKGYRAFKVIYSFHNRVRWLHLADATAIGLEDARNLARKVMNQVAEVRTHKPRRRRSVTSAPLRSWPIATAMSTPR